MSFTIAVYKVQDRPMPVQPDLLRAPKPVRVQLFQVQTGTVPDEEARVIVKHLFEGFPRSKGFELEVIRWSNTGHFIDPLTFINEV